MIHCGFFLSFSFAVFLMLECIGWGVEFTTESISLLDVGELGLWPFPDCKSVRLWYEDRGRGLA